LNPDPKNLKPINICAFTVKIAPRLNIIPGSATGGGSVQSEKNFGEQISV
jgi:hypothetical protein